MKWQYAELQKYKTESLQFSEVVDLKEPLLATFGDVVLDVTPLTVTGFAQADREDIIIHANVKGKLVTPSTRSLTPVEMDVDFDIDEVYLQNEEHADRYEIEDSVILIEDGLIDFDQALMEYVALSVPLQVLTEEEKDQPMPKGKGWAVISEDDFEQKQEEAPAQANTPLAGLADLFKDED